MPSTVNFIKKEKAWQKKFDANAPKVGELADVNGENRVRISDIKGCKLVVLVFSSFT